MSCIIDHTELCWIDAGVSFAIAMIAILIATIIIDYYRNKNKSKAK